MSRALAGCTHPGLDRVLQWDLRYGADVVSTLLPHVPDAALRERLDAATREAWDRISRLAPELPTQAVHPDLTDANVVASRGADGVIPDGVIDFGDLSQTWAVNELAITASCVLGHPGTDPTSILPAIRAFHAIRPVSPAEAQAVWPLLVLRSAVLIVSGAQQARLDPDNDYLTAQSDAERRMFEQATSVPLDVMSALITTDLGLSAPPPPVHGRLLDVDPGAVVTLDLATVADGYDNGRWLIPDVESEIACAALDDGAALAVTQHGQPQLSRAPKLSQRSPAVVATDLDLWSAADVALTAPWDGEVASCDDRVTVRGSEYVLTLVGASCSVTGAVTSGQPMATTVARQRVRVSIAPVGAPEAPAFTSAELAPGWLAVTRDPRPLLGLAPIEAGDRDGLLARREASFAPVQEHYYRTPPQIERGWRHYMLSTAGRCYLDMVNNVTVLGHAHPRVAETAARQLRKLNTNSRFNYEAVVEYSERLAATLPEPLDTVFLVNSGRRQAIWRSGWRRPRPAAATSSRCGRPTTAGRTAPMRCRRRPPTTRTR